MKKMLLISLLLIFILGFSVNAFVPVVKPTLKVELIAPENIQVNVPFMVDVYVSANKDKIGLTVLELTSTPGLEFTGKANSGDFYVGNFPHEAGFVLKNKNILSITSIPFLPLDGKEKLASVELVVKSNGAFNLGLNTDNSVSQWSPQDKYVLSSPSITIAVGCVPKIKFCSDLGTVKIGEGPSMAYPNCGYLDNGCGKAINCGVCNTYCVNNYCMPAEVVLFPPTAEEKELCKNVLMVTSGSPENTKNEINLIKGVASALKKSSFNEKFTDLVAALKVWFLAIKP